MAIKPTFFSKSSWDQWQLKTARTWHDLEDTYQSVHHRDLDKEHLVLVDLVLELNSMIDKLKESSFSLDFIYQIAEVCDRLHQRLSEHFELEEQVLKDLEIAEEHVHHEQHQKILHQLEILIEDLTEGKFAVNLEFKNQILEWTLEHMIDEDYKLLTPKHIAFFMFRCEDFEKVNKWIPKLNMGFDKELLEITKLIMQMFHQQKESTKELILLMEPCFVKEERILLKYLPKGVVSLHVRKHREMLSLVKSGGKFNVEKLFQLWLSHLLMRDKEDFKISHWLPHNLVRFIELKAPNSDESLFKLNYELATKVMNLGEVLELMVDLSKNKGEMQKMISDFKLVTDEMRASLKLISEKEISTLKSSKNDQVTSNITYHQTLQEKIDLLILLIESHQLALASFHYQEFKQIWCLHLCFHDYQDLVAGAG